MAEDYSITKAFPEDYQDDPFALDLQPLKEHDIWGAHKARRYSLDTNFTDAGSEFNGEAHKAMRSEQILQGTSSSWHFHGENMPSYRDNLMTTLDETLLLENDIAHDFTFNGEDGTHCSQGLLSASFPGVEGRECETGGMKRERNSMQHFGQEVIDQRLTKRTKPSGGNNAHIYLFIHETAARKLEFNAQTKWRDFKSLHKELLAVPTHYGHDFAAELEEIVKDTRQTFKTLYRERRRASQLKTFTALSELLHKSAKGQQKGIQNLVERCFRGTSLACNTDLYSALAGYFENIMRSTSLHRGHSVPYPKEIVKTVISQHARLSVLTIQKQWQKFLTPYDIQLMLLAYCRCESCQNDHRIISEFCGCSYCSSDRRITFETESIYLEFVSMHLTKMYAFQAKELLKLHLSGADITVQHVRHLPGTKHWRHRDIVDTLNVIHRRKHCEMCLA